MCENFHKLRKRINMPEAAPVIGSNRRTEPRRDLRSSTKTNSSFKWKVDKTVIGALEITSEPDLDVRATMIRRDIHGFESEMDKCYKIWKKLKLKNEFIEAFESIPPETTCCGLLTEQDETIKKNTVLLNKGWVKTTNESHLKKEGFQISMFVWSWTNISGKSETVIPMIRFHKLSIDV